MLLLVAPGTSGIKPNISTFGADQIDPTEATAAHGKESFFMYLYLTVNLGCVVAFGFLATGGLPPLVSQEDGCSPAGVHGEEHRASCVASRSMLAGWSAYNLREGGSHGLGIFAYPHYPVCAASVTPKQLVVGRATFSHQVFGRSANGHCWKCDLQRAVQHHVQSFLFSGHLRPARWTFAGAAAGSCRGEALWLAGDQQHAAWMISGLTYVDFES